MEKIYPSSHWLINASNLKSKITTNNTNYTRKTALAIPARLYWLYQQNNTGYTSKTTLAIPARLYWLYQQNNTSYTSKTTLAIPARQH